MTERPENNDRREEQEPFVPASPVKRIMAWVGIVYMVGLVILNIYPFFNQGNYLTGIAPLFACPGIAGIFAISLYLARHPDPLVRHALAGHGGTGLCLSEDRQLFHTVLMDLSEDPDLRVCAAARESLFMWECCSPAT